MSAPVVAVRDLTVAYRDGDDWSRVVHGVSFAIARGEVFGMVGESGCGKSTIGLQLLGYRQPSMRAQGGEVLFDGHDLLTLPRRDLDRLRGNRIGFVPQNPTTALNPSIRVGAQVAEVLRLHGRARSDSDARARIIALFDLVGLPDPDNLRLRYPHQLSGGQQQRVCIAMAVACEPDLVVLDEPTTGLDVTTQEQIIALLVDLRARLGTAMFYVTHDLGLLAQIADRIGVMYAGHLAETGPAREVFGAPRHPYTAGLIASVPRIEAEPGEAVPAPLKGALRRRELPPGCAFAPRCAFALPACAENPQVLEPVAPGHAVACQRWPELGADPVPRGAPAQARAGSDAPAPETTPLLACRSLTIDYAARRGVLARLLPHRPAVAVADFDLTIGRGETLALVGESGSGKSTVARAISGLVPPVDGDIAFDGATLSPSERSRTPDQRRRMQFIFQNPDASLNPRRTVGDALARPLRVFQGKGRRAAEPTVRAALAAVQLEPAYAERYPDQLSGGERQRVAIARALVAEPDLLLCDEILSALDVSVQANVIELLSRLVRETGIAMLFISHDLAVVRTLADRVAVLFRGQLMQTGPNAATFTPPYHPYTYALLRAVPSVDSVKPAADSKSRREPVRGAACAFAGRCQWQVGDICVTEPPPWRETPEGARIRCHIPLPELERLGTDLAFARRKPAPSPQRALA